MSAKLKAAAAVADDELSGDIEPRLYEICILYPYPMNQKEEAVLLKEIDGLFSEADATLIDKDTWGRRGLAYPIKGSKEGNFIIYYYELAPGKLREIDEALRIVPGVLRHLIVKPPKGYQMVKYAEIFETWMKERVTIEEKRERAKEEELRERVVAKARRQAKRAEEEKKEVPEKKPAIAEEKLTEELEKLISDDELGL